MRVYGPFKDIYDGIKDTFEYRLATLALDITEKIQEVMHNRGINRIDLAKKMGVNRASISQFLNEGSNITIKRLLKIAEALDCTVNIKIEENNAHRNNVKHLFEAYGPAFQEKCLVQFSDDYIEMGEYNETACG